MTLPRRQFLHLAAGAAALPAVSRVAWAQTYPSRPITIVVPFPAGGSTGALARILLEPLQKALGQPVIIENVGGAGGSIGVGRVARAAPDGYTVSLSHMQTHVLNGAVLNLPYDVVKDFESVALISDTPQAIIARMTFPANDLKGCDRLAESQSRQGDIRRGWRRRPERHRRLSVPEADRHASPGGAVSRRWTAAD